MIASPRQAAARATSRAPTRRLTDLLFGFLVPPTRPATGPLGNPARRAGAELADDPTMREALRALQLQQAHGPLPATLSFVPGRICESAELDAIGLADGRCASVTADLAIWRQPCSAELTDVAWRRVFTWVTGADRNLAGVTILSPPRMSNAGLVGSYSYLADGVAGYGVLQVSRRNDGSWRIADCWGDATDSARIDELATELACVA